MAAASSEALCGDSSDECWCRSTPGPDSHGPAQGTSQNHQGPSAANDNPGFDDGGASSAPPGVSFFSPQRWLFALSLTGPTRCPTAYWVLLEGLEGPTERTDLIHGGFFFCQVRAALVGSVTAVLTPLFGPIGVVRVILKVSNNVNYPSSSSSNSTFRLEARKVEQNVARAEVIGVAGSINCGLLIPQISSCGHGSTDVGHKQTSRAERSLLYDLVRADRVRY